MTANEITPEQVAAARERIEQWEATGAPHYWVIYPDADSYAQGYQMYRLDRQIVEAAEAVDMNEEPKISDLCMLVARLARQLLRVDPNNDVATKAIDYLRRKSLGPKVLR